MPDFLCRPHAALLLSLLLAGCAADAPPAPVMLRILAFNDFHGNIQAEDPSPGRLPVMVDGKVRGRILVEAGASAEALEAAARADEKVAAVLEGATVRKVVAVPDKMVNFVVG